jgi:hypothetical protein
MVEPRIEVRVGDLLKLLRNVADALGNDSPNVVGIRHEILEFLDNLVIGPPIGVMSVHYSESRDGRGYPPVYPC